MSDLQQSLEPLTSQQMRVLNYIEQYWHQYSRFPPATDIEAHYPDFNLTASLRHPTFQLGLSNRGVEPPGAHGELSPEQVAAIMLVLDFNDKRSLPAKLRSLGLNSTRWNGWMRDPEFKKYFENLSNTFFQDSLDTIHRGLLNSAEKGNVDAIKYYMELTGRYTQTSPALQNIRLVMARIIESIQRHVDAHVIESIQGDFEIILQGGDPGAVSMDKEVVRQIEGSL